jgi:hypothetical protein
MSEYKVKVWASINMVGGDAEETIDLVDDFGVCEADAKAFIDNGCQGNKDIEDDLVEYAHEIIGFECGFHLPEEDEEDEE